MSDAELIKSKIDIVDFISEFIQLKKAGRHFKALCPFHSEKTPSFIVSPERQSWHCFGACAMGGDIITFLEKWEGIEFIEALQLLAKRTGVALSKYTPSQETAIKDKLYEINHLASEFYHYILISHRLGKRAAEYLKLRGIKDRIVKTFKIGYAPNNWDNLYRYLLKKGYTASDLLISGVVIQSQKGGYYDRFRGRLMFTLTDARSNIIGFSGRKIPPEDEEEAKYINTPETPVYIKGNSLYGLNITRESIKKEKEAVVVEGEFDFLASFQSGVTNIVAIKGSALTENQTILLKRYSESILLALDSDFAGNEAAKRGFEIAENAGLTVKIVKLGYGKDPADCINKSPHIWKTSLKQAVPVYDFVFGQVMEKYNKNDILGKKKISEEVIPYLSKIQNPIIASHYIKKLAKGLNVDEGSIDAAITKFEKKETIPRKSDIKVTAKQLRDELLEEHFLALIIQSDRPGDEIEKSMKILSVNDFFLPSVKTIINLLIDFLKKNKKFNTKKFNKFISPEISQTFDLAFMTDIAHIIRDQSLYHRELMYTVREIKKKSMRRRVADLATKIRKLEKENKSKETDKIAKEIRQIINNMQDLEK